MTAASETGVAWPDALGKLDTGITADMLNTAAELLIEQKGGNGPKLKMSTGSSISGQQRQCHWPSNRSGGRLYGETQRRRAFDTKLKRLLQFERPLRGRSGTWPKNSYGKMRRSAVVMSAKYCTTTRPPSHDMRLRSRTGACTAGTLLENKNRRSIRCFASARR